MGRVHNTVHDFEDSSKLRALNTLYESNRDRYALRTQLFEIYNLGKPFIWEPPRPKSQTFITKLADKDLNGGLQQMRHEVQYLEQRLSEAQYLVQPPYQPRILLRPGAYNLCSSCKNDNHNKPKKSTCASCFWWCEVRRDFVFHCREKETQGGVFVIKPCDWIQRCVSYPKKRKRDDDDDSSPSDSSDSSDSSSDDEDDDDDSSSSSSSNDEDDGGEGGCMV